jgi:hypothetical protein
MSNRTVRRSVGGLAGMLVATLLAAAPAAANGPCGQDFNGDNACPVNTASTTSYSGSLVTDNESDYYVFYAQKGTELSVTITDTENPSCSTSAGYCGGAAVNLDDAQGNQLDGTDGSTPNNGITVPQRFSHTLESAGTYYLIVSGYLGTDQNQNPTAVPYTLNVSASPNVQWPAPPPSCKVPGFHRASLATVEQRIAAGHCTVGSVRHQYSRSTRRGRVLSLSPGAGTSLANGAPVSVVVSAGRKPHKHHRKHHHG